MKNQTQATILLFLAGFFAKDIIDNIGFLLTDNYPLNIFGMRITAIHHKVMLVISSILTIIFLYYGCKKLQNKVQNNGKNV